MPTLNQILERLRRMRPPPGAAAGAVAVPTAGEQLTGEVEFLFASLDELERESDRILAAAHAAADELEEQARDRARRLLEEAHATALRTTAELSDARSAACERQAQALLAEAERDAERILVRGRERIPALADAVAERILEGSERILEGSV